MNLAAPIPYDRDQFIGRLRAEAEARYHDKHSFHVRMNAGELTREEIQGWVLNRFYYQSRIPIKDALILSKSEDPHFRRSWIRRIHDQDGSDGGDGGLALWLELAEAVGLKREYVSSLRGVLPAVRFACDAYVALVRERSLVEAVASSLTEMFAPPVMEARIGAWQQHYPWINLRAQAYFRGRVPRAAKDGQEALDFVLAHATTRALQERCIDAFVCKCQILLALLDAVESAYRSGSARVRSRAERGEG